MVDYTDVWFRRAQELSGKSPEQIERESYFFRLAQERIAQEEAKKVYITTRKPWEGRTSPGGGPTIPRQVEPIPAPGGKVTRTDVTPEPTTPKSVIEPGPFAEPEVPREGVVLGGMDYSLGPYGHVPVPTEQLERRVSPEETISPESERLRMRDIERGQAQIEGPTEQARELSHIAFGDPEAEVPSPETFLPKTISAGAEWVITLPAETVKSGVTAQRIGAEIIETGPSEFISKQAKFIGEDPAARGTGLVLSASLIGAPVGKAAFTRFRGGRAVDTVVTTPEQPTIHRGGYMVYETEAVFLREGPKIRAKAVTDVKYPGTQDTAKIVTESVTQPRGEEFLTIGESKIAGKSKIDLTTPTRELDVTISRPKGELDVSRFQARQVTETGQVTLEGKPAPTVQDISGVRITRAADSLTDISLGVTKGKVSTIELGRTTLLEQARAGKVTVRRTQTIEGYMERDAFLKLIERQEGPRDLGISQETLRGFEPGAGKYTGPRDPGISAAEISIMANVKSFVDMKIPRPRPGKISAPTKAVEPTAPAVSRPTRQIPGVGDVQAPEISPVDIQRGLPGRFEGIEGPWTARKPPEYGLIDDQALKIDTLAQNELLEAQKTLGLGELSGLKPQVAHYTGQELLKDVAQGQKQRQGQMQAQGLGLASETMLTQKHRLSLKAPETTPNVRPPRLYRGGVGPRPRGLPPVFPLIPPGAPPSGAPVPARPPRKRKKDRLLTYAPSLTGIVSGVEITGPIKKSLTGLEARFPVRRKKS